MKSQRTGLALAVKEHLHSGRPITRLEALILYGVSNLPDVISEMRKDGWTIKSRPVAFAAALRRVNEFAVVEPPANLPVREIQLTDYWLVR
ncbi:helix-turn-helix domain-containing protein [Labrenzia sp. ac12]